MTNPSQDNGIPLPLFLVEDDSTIGHILRVLLTNNGYDVHWARDGREAANAISTILPPRIVLLDLMLPFVDGFELLTRIRVQPGWAEIPALVLSGRSMEVDIVRTFNIGASDFLRKPFNPAELIARLNRLLAFPARCTSPASGPPSHGPNHLDLEQCVVSQ